MNTNSIDAAQRKALDKFYRKRILSLAGHAQLPPFPAAPEAVGDSYFVVRRQTTLPRQAFELQTADEAAVAETLRRQRAGTPLEDLVKPLLKLCKQFPEVHEKSEVSSFVYEMF